jgi:hypothetical protein
MPYPALVIPNAVAVRLIGLAAGSLAINVLHARKTSGLTITQAIANTVGAAVKSAWSTHLAGLMADNSALTSVGLRDLTSPNFAEFIDTGTAVPGTGPGDALPGSNACCLSLKTALAGKSFRGRTYLSGFNEAQNDAEGRMNTATAAAAVAFLTAVQGALSTSGLTLGVASRPSYAYTTVKNWTLPDGTTISETIGRGNMRAGSIEPVTLIQSRDADWESQRRRSHGAGSGAGTLSVLAQSVVGGD